MLVTCVCQGPQESWSEKAQKIFSEHSHPPWDDNIEVSREYPVYGVFFWEGFPWYLICDEPRDKYPTPKFALLFEQSDATMPAEWVLVPDRGHGKGAALLPPAWASDDTFYERLLDGDLDCEEVFQRIKSASPTARRDSEDT